MSFFIQTDTINRYVISWFYTNK